MGTEYKNLPLSEYVIHKIDYAESAEEYSYYLYIHPSGQAIIMRINAEETEFLYANAGRNIKMWDDRADSGINYTTFDKLAKG